VCFHNNNICCESLPRGRDYMWNNWEWRGRKDRQTKMVEEMLFFFLGLRVFWQVHSPFEVGEHFVLLPRISWPELRLAPIWLSFLLLSFSFPLLLASLLHLLLLLLLIALPLAVVLRQQFVVPNHHRLFLCPKHLVSSSVLQQPTALQCLRLFGFVFFVFFILKLEGNKRVVQWIYCGSRSALSCHYIFGFVAQNIMV